MKFKICMYVPLCFFLFKCKNKPNDPNLEYIIVSNSDSPSQCAFVLDKKNNELIQYACQQEGKLNGDFITYFPGGRMKSVRTFRLDTLVGTSIEYYENGLIKQISSYSENAKTVEVKSFDEGGFLREIRFSENDSLYYTRTYSDSLKSEVFTNLCKPILILEKDTFSIFDSIQFQIRFPLPEAYNLPSLGLQLRYDRFPKQMVEGKNPFAKHTTPLDKEDTYIGITSDLPSADRFVYYVTDSAGIVISPLLYKDVYFIATK